MMYDDYAAENNSEEIGEILISKGADINAKDKDGKTPLHYAAWYNLKDIGEKGSDVNARDNDGMTPLHYAEQYFQQHFYQDYAPAMLFLLRNHGAKEW